ncbi:MULTISPECIES: glycosyltransferase family 4 protein [unclassified Cellulophaga]|uniref:glycosyltransferase family 4 protein n=1 Tax=unclassified Cellulophaga TaxID=2634405 RepID=UPI0026E26B89|nr:MULTISPECIES: glycosyltransferase family 4 protein [unclassified Cellulophaga]MDO6491466.1 glycosyltransferase family 4 protein [Cellulophaga sp. 2_MG-2023]MDO6493343.1 glycosyltransferase family 4 protein [Cellulophaga sp. 3_MG-2023]
MERKKIIRITTVPVSLKGLLKGQLNYINNFYNVIGISSNDNGVLESVAEQENIQVIPVELTRKITPIQDLKSLWVLYCVLKKEKPYIVHTHTPKAGTIGMIASYLARVPHRLHTIAGLPLLEATGKKRILLNFVEKITYKFATKIYPNSFGLQQIILDHKFTKQNKLKVLGNGSSNGINTSIFNPDLISANQKNELRNSLDIKKTDYVFIFLGRIVADKGINELVTAFCKLNKENKNTKLLLVGTFEEELDPLDTTTVSKIKENKDIIVTGWQTDVKPYLSIANTLTFPSYREGFPNVVMQAGAMGLPSIVTNINGCNEIIIEEVNGTIIPVKNSDILYKKMLSFYLDKTGKYNTTHCRQLIIDRYNQSYIWKEILEEYNSLSK